jgi:SAM-dependent methyltransferase
VHQTGPLNVSDENEALLAIISQSFGSGTETAAALRAKAERCKRLAYGAPADLRQSLVPLAREYLERADLLEKEQRGKEPISAPPLAKNRPRNVASASLRRGGDRMKTLDYQTELKLLEEQIRRQARHGEVLQILEAGCGREWYFKLDHLEYEVTGVDLDSHALTHRKDEMRDLDRAIVGDLRTVGLPEAYFDVVYCSFVLEHIQHADQVLDNFVKWLKPGGILIIRVPDLRSTQTFLARHLPRWCAILYYRAAWGIKNAGAPGFAPYPAFYDEVISTAGFHHYCSSHNLVVTNEIGVGSYTGRGNGPLRYLLPVIAKLIRLLSGGRIHDRHVDRTFVAFKEASKVQLAR